MKRILEIVLNAEGTIGGEQRHVLALLDGLDRDAFAPTVVTWDIPAFVDELDARGVPSIVVSGTRILDLALLRRIEAVISAGSFDLVHTHGHRGGLLGRVAALRAGRSPLVWTCHLAENKADRNPIAHGGYRRMLRYLHARTAATIAVSDQLRDWLASEGIDAAGVDVIPNGVDDAVFRALPLDPELLADLGLMEDRPTIVCVARLTEQKGVATLIDAAMLLAKSGTPAQVLVVGAGPLEDELKVRAARSEAHVVFAGQRSDVPEVLALADVVVVPSLWEGAFCFSVLEAMACGKPLVCSDIPMFTDVIRDGSEARTFAAGDADSLFDVVGSVLRDPQAARALGAAGRRLVVEKYSVECMRGSTFAVYERVMGGEIS